MTEPAQARPAPSADTAPSVGFLCCVEDGALEDQALLLVRSIRRFAGTLADAPIYVVAPRASREPSDYGMANKWDAGLWAEEHATTDMLVFVDSDTIFCADPTALRLPDGIDLAARPVDRKYKGSTGPGDEREGYRQRLYELTGVTERPWVDTPVRPQRIRAYCNGGLVVTRRSERLFSAWYKDFLTLEHAGHLPPEGMRYMDQVSLGATIARRWDRTQIPRLALQLPLAASCGTGRTRPKCRARRPHPCPLPPVARAPRLPGHARAAVGRIITGTLVPGATPATPASAPQAAADAPPQGGPDREATGHPDSRPTVARTRFPLIVRTRHHDPLLGHGLPDVPCSIHAA